MPRTLTALALAFSALGATPLWAETRALVVGINDYAHVESLVGARADAEDISRSLAALGVRDLKTLVDGEATRAAIESAWWDLLLRSSPGDVAIFSYAGHGASEPDQNGDEAEESRGNFGDVLDENFILAGFNPQTREGLRERIVDDEIDLWIQAAVERGITVVFIADSCHAGTVNRSMIAQNAAPPSWGRFSRDAAVYLSQGAPLPSADGPPPPFIPAAPPGTPRGLSFFASAVNQADRVNEVSIPGVPGKRGALSYLFARALEGRADKNGDGVLDHMELGRYLVEGAQSFDNDAIRDFEPKGVPPFPLLRLPHAAVQAPAAPPVFDVRLGVRGGPPPANLPEGARIVAENPELIYDLATGNLLDEEGVLVSERASLDGVGLQAVVDKYRLANFVKSLAAQSPISASLSPQESFYKIGLRDVALRAGPSDRTWLTVFNIANNGEIQAIFPDPAIPEQTRRQGVGMDYAINTRIAEPPGADHLAAIASNVEPVALRRAVAEKADGARILTILREMAAQEALSAGLLLFYATR